MNLRWNGGKLKASFDLRSLLPMEFDEYREPFAGNASMLWVIPPDKKRWINDIDRDVVAYHRAMQSQTDYVDAIIELQAGLETATEMEHQFNLSKVRWYFYDDMVAYFLLNRFAYGQMVRRSRNNIASFSYAYLQDGFRPITRTRLEQSRQIYQGVRITQRPYWELLDAPGDNVALMLDPPYLLSQDNSSIYEYDFTVEDHEELRDRLVACKHKFVMTIGNCGLSHRLYVRGSDFNIYTRKYGYSCVWRAEMPKTYEMIVTNF